MAYNKQDLVDTIQAINPELTATQAAQTLTTTLKAITLLTEEEDSQLTIRSFGTFTRTTSPSRPGRNPATGKEVIIPSRSYLRFKASSALRYEDTQ